uniref:Uncharacterized protein n=1 Tax=Anguilla anguilla TaxID=7936 RepID=A0A0E9PP09_ANGAN
MCGVGTLWDEVGGWVFKGQVLGEFYPLSSRTDRWFSASWMAALREVG